jgi:hypothetical protein
MLTKGVKSRKGQLIVYSFFCRNSGWGVEMDVEVVFGGVGICLPFPGEGMPSGGGGE